MGTDMKELADLRDQLREFARARDWDQFHSPKNLAMALSVEAGELLEIFQWLTQEQSRSLAPDAQAAVHDAGYDLQQVGTRLPCAERRAARLGRPGEERLER